MAAVPRRHSQDTGMLPHLPVRSARHLGVIQVGVHRGVGVDEPGADETRDVGRVLRVAVEHPCDRVVEDRVSEVAELADVVDEAAVRVEEPIPRVVRAGRPDCVPPSA